MWNFFWNPKFWPTTACNFEFVRHLCWVAQLDHGEFACLPDRKKSAKIPLSYYYQIKLFNQSHSWFLLIQNWKFSVFTDLFGFKLRNSGQKKPVGQLTLGPENKEYFFLTPKCFFSDCKVDQKDPLANFERFWYSRTFLKKFLKVQNQAKKFSRPVEKKGSFLIFRSHMVKIKLTKFEKILNFSGVFQRDQPPA